MNINEIDFEKLLEAFPVERIIYLSDIGYPDAIFIKALYILKGIINSGRPNPVHEARRLMSLAANAGSMQARAFLNGICLESYNKSFKSKLVSSHEGPLVDLDGKTFRIDRKGAFTPIDAELVYENGENILRLSLDLNIIGIEIENMENLKKVEDTIVEGIMEWQGEYKVFGGQKLKVEINCTIDQNIYDCVSVMLVTKEARAYYKQLEDNSSGTVKKAYSRLRKSNRSFAYSGIKWNARARRFIQLYSKDDTFNDYEEIKHVMKHEFGHALGLGDLYPSIIDDFKGVKLGTYPDLDSYYISEKRYNLVMCDHHGPISNNDIEMVVLAFSRNRRQLYQQMRCSGEISKALGRGN